MFSWFLNWKIIETRKFLSLPHIITRVLCGVGTRIFKFQWFHCQVFFDSPFTFDSGSSQALVLSLSRSVCAQRRWCLLEGKTCLLVKWSGMLFIFSFNISKLPVKIYSNQDVKTYKSKSPLILYKTNELTNTRAESPPDLILYAWDPLIQPWVNFLNCNKKPLFIKIIYLHMLLFSLLPRELSGLTKWKGNLGIH